MDYLRSEMSTANLFPASELNTNIISGGTIMIEICG